MIQINVPVTSVNMPAMAKNWMKSRQMRYAWLSCLSGCQNSIEPMRSK